MEEALADGRTEEEIKAWISAHGPNGFVPQPTPSEHEDKAASTSFEAGMMDDIKGGYQRQTISSKCFEEKNEEDADVLSMGGESKAGEHEAIHRRTAETAAAVVEDSSALVWEKLKAFGSPEDIAMLELPTAPMGWKTLSCTFGPSGPWTYGGDGYMGFYLQAYCLRILLAHTLAIILSGVPCVSLVNRPWRET